LSPDRWTKSFASTYSSGENPWIDVFTSKVATDAAKSIGQDDIETLRKMLAIQGDKICRQVKDFGGVASPSEKRLWRKKAMQEAKRLKISMSDVEPYLSSAIGKSKTGHRMSTASEMRDAIRLAAESVSHLLELLEFVDDNASEEKYEYSEGASPRFAKAIYLQFVVDRMAEVFVAFRGCSNVKRTVSDGKTDGEFAHFVRVTALPAIDAYVGLGRQTARGERLLNEQIQLAKERFNPTM